ncbi:PE-PPE domain-containing protein [Mycobacterium sp. OTB74]|uniref:PE-PPE domain-containing protein n=1 Tax=Mycobacterium sp. OTB74 TaxID=1853452 RepID=UPI00247451CA|nr:PE-PPE domain-containing protein [Mycobacterium sp. OTB74]MDH6244088.1 hypothetical protein [Mycobacterium sp. OTB74]
MLENLVAAVTPLLLIVGGSSPTPDVAGETPPVWLNGQFNKGDTIVSVPYPASFGPYEGTGPMGPSVQVGVTNALALQNVAVSQGIPTTLMGASQGALVIDQVIADDARNGVDPKAVSFIVIEDPERGSGILTGFRGITIPIIDYKPIQIPVSPYNVTVVTVEYDGIADFPNNVLNVLADINAIMGAATYHSTVAYSNLADVPQADITVSTNGAGGVTTSYLVPTVQLPLTEPLRLLGIPAQVVDAIDRVLRPIIDSAYVGRLKIDAAPAAEETTSKRLSTESTTHVNVPRNDTVPGRQPPGHARTTMTVRPVAPDRPILQSERTIRTQRPHRMTKGQNQTR